MIMGQRSFNVYGLYCRVRKVSNGLSLTYKPKYYFRVEVHKGEKLLGDYHASAKTFKEALNLVFEQFDSLKGYKNGTNN